MLFSSQTGHSLGGAVATLCAADYASYFLDPFVGQVTRIHLATFGSPRVGDKPFVQVRLQIIITSNYNKNRTRMNQSSCNVSNITSNNNKYRTRMNHLAMCRPKQAFRSFMVPGRPVFLTAHRYVNCHRELDIVDIVSIVPGRFFFFSKKL
jgi:hypothetical protein